MIEKKLLKFLTVASLSIVPVCTLNTCCVYAMKDANNIGTYGNESISLTKFQQSVPYKNAYYLLQKDYTISSIDYSNTESVARRKFELDKILSENLSETEKSTIDSSWEKKVVDNCFAFEKLYDKYNTSPAIELSDKEYCNVFDIIPYEIQKNKAKHAYYEYFNHVGVHRRFVIAKASEDNSVLNDANVLQKYLELINYEDSLYSNKNILLKPWYRWSLAYSAFDCENFEKLFDGYKEQLEAILKKIEPLVDKNFKIK